MRLEALLRASRTRLDQEGSVAWRNVLLHFSPQNVLVHFGRSRLILLEFVGVVVRILWMRMSTHLARML